MKTLILSSLEKVFKNEEPSAEEIKEFSMLKNERASFQVALFSDIDVKLDISYGFDGEVKIYTVEYVPVSLACYENADDYYVRKEAGDYPDYLVSADCSVTLKAGEWKSVWFELITDKAGKQKVSVSFTDSDSKVVSEKSVDVEIINAELPDTELVYTNWYHCDGIINYYGVPAFSEEFWRINENFVKTAARHGMNCILTPVFTPPLDTKIGGERTTVQLVDVYHRGGSYIFKFAKLKRWIDMCQRCGIKYYEISHLFTQWGALHSPKVMAVDSHGRTKRIFGWDTKTKSKEYEKFILSFGKALTAFLEKNGIADRCFVHVSDEPSDDDLPVYLKRAALIKKAFPGYKVIDALSHLEFYQTGAVSQPIPSTSAADKFYGNVPELWVYYCCGQHKNYLSNRFIAMPSQRTRVIGYQLYRYNVKGFLQWGYNFYNTCLSTKAINPFEITDAGGFFAAGDAFVVYPGKDGEVYPSLRIKVFYDALQDFRALKKLEELIGFDKTVEILEKECDEPITFNSYPRSAKWHLKTRETINKKIKELTE